MFSLLRTGSVLAAMTLALPASADAQWFDWNWGWGQDYYQPAGAWTSYYPGSYGYSGYGGGYYAPGGCCNPCACNPCCDPCGGSACGAGGCASGNCAGGNCAYDAPAGGAPVPDPNVDTPPLRSRTAPTPRTRSGDPADAPTFESPTRGTDPADGTTPFPPRSRSTNPLDDVEPLPRRNRSIDSADPADTGTDPFDRDGTRGGTGTGAGSRNFRDNSTAPTGGTRPRTGTGSDGGLLDPANDPDFGGSKKIEIPEAEGTVIKPRTPAKTPAVDDGKDAGVDGPRLDLKATSAPVVPKTRLASHARNATVAAPRTARTPVIRDWSAAMNDARVVR
ncbi:MAG TPA: hypothetical protein VM165_02430 [Planctomycetaceae bacterium]|nr:hypothetical protein [Planctomycetaceae bacterium]